MVQLKISAGRPASLGAGLMEALVRYRHRVFVDKLHWKLTATHGLELDQFDREDTMYVVAHTHAGDVVGTARLLPTERPYLLGEIFPQLMANTELPCDREVWELSRFAATNPEAPHENSLSQFSSPIAVALLGCALRVAASHGVRRLIAVSPVGVERLLRREGFAARRAAPPVLIDGHEVFACWIEATDSVLLCPPEGALS